MNVYFEDSEIIGQVFEEGHKPLNQKQESAISKIKEKEDAQEYEVSNTVKTFREVGFSKGSRTIMYRIFDDGAYEKVNTHVNEESLTEELNYPGAPKGFEEETLTEGIEGEHAIKVAIQKYEEKKSTFEKIANDKVTKKEKEHAQSRVEYYSKEIDALRKKLGE